jgi:glycolate oxidase iron-sulfur subunit
MQTRFTAKQLADPGVAHCEKILRSCVHCGFCTATCPTYVLLGDELDGPRGRINLIKDMLENDRPASDEVVTHVDRCLSCLSCMTTCPSGVNYMHLVDHARAHIERTYRRTFEDRMMRALIAFVLPRRRLFALSLAPARLMRPFLPVLRRIPGLDRLAAMLALVPPRRAGAGPSMRAGATLAGEGFPAGRVIVMQGCVQPALNPHITRATIDMLVRHGHEVVVARGEGCCGALAHHLGRKQEALRAARRMIDIWLGEVKRAGVDAVIVTASGCGTTIKDYAHMLRDDPDYAGRAERVCALAKDVHEFLAERGFGPTARATGLRVAYHAACSMQHGQKIRKAPRALLEAAGFEVVDVPEGHLCCGSAGSYNILQPEIAGALRERKVANIERVEPDLIATGNIGCMTQIAGATSIPVVHTVELLNWASGGEMPPALRRAGLASPEPPAEKSAGPVRERSAAAG